MPFFVGRALVVLGVASGLGLAAPAVASASNDTGHLYVNDNTAGTNTISGYDRHADGSLTPLPGSPFVAGGSGTGTGLASQGAIQVSSDGRYGIAVDAGSDQISVLGIYPDGTLALVPSGPVSSGGSAPVSVAVHNGLVYVANAGSANSNYTGFVLGRHGQLEPLADSTFPLPAPLRSRETSCSIPTAGTWSARASEPRRRIQQSTASESTAMDGSIPPQARHSLSRGRVPSEASSDPRIQINCTCETPTAGPGPERSRRSRWPAMGPCSPSETHLSTTIRRRPVGWRSPTTGGSCSP